MKIKLMSFNTQHCKNYLEQKIDFDIMAKTVLSLGADFVGLNEMRGAGEDAEYTAQTETLAALTGMENYYFAKAIDVPDGGPYGNAFISKLAITEVENIPIPDPVVKKYDGYYESRCLLRAKLECGLTVLVVHMGLNPDERESAVKTVIENMPKEKCILMGDFNAEPDDCILDPIRALMRDTAELFDEEKKSFPSDKPRMKIDYIFATRDVKVLSADIPAAVASDHRPYIAEIEI